MKPATTTPATNTSGNSPIPSTVSEKIYKAVLNTAQEITSQDEQSSKDSQMPREIKVANVKVDKDNDAKKAQILREKKRTKAKVLKKRPSKAKARKSSKPRGSTIELGQTKAVTSKFKDKVARPKKTNSKKPKSNKKKTESSESDDSMESKVKIY